MCKYHHRSNGPVNTPLTSGPTLITKTSFAKFEIIAKSVKVISGSLYKNCVELEFIMSHAKFHDPRIISSV